MLWCGQGVAPGKVRAGDCVPLGQVSNSLALNSTASTCQGPRHQIHAEAPAAGAARGLAAALLRPYSGPRTQVGTLPATWQPRSTDSGGETRPLV